MFGYDDPLLSLGTQLPEGMFPPFDKFAWFYQRNNSDYYDGVFSVFTGGDNIIKLGEMDMWNLRSFIDKRANENPATENILVLSHS